MSPSPATLSRRALLLAALAALPAHAAGFRFAPYPTRRPLPDLSFVDGDGRSMKLDAFRGKVVLLNVWATWCPPCVAEMPTLNKLQQLLGGKDFAVVPLSVDKGGVFTVKSFYQENFIDHLPVYVDPTTHALDALHVLGTPTTILVDRDGHEIARTLGPEDWDKPEIIAELRRYIAAR